MHGRFRDFLRLCVEAPDADVDDLNTLRLCTIEEMFDWTEDRRRTLRWWGWPQPFSLKRRHEDINGWRATALSYVNDKAELVARVENAPKCYGEHFLSFIQSAPE